METAAIDGGAPAGLGLPAERLEAVAMQLRRDVVRQAYEAHTAHVSSGLSIVDIVTALYFHALRVAPTAPGHPDRDRFLLSKGHACAALYAALARRGFFSEDLLHTYCQNDGILGGHPEPHMAPGIEITTGALGHGLSMGMGIALGGKLDRRDYRVFVQLSDGECDEGAVWEAALAAAHFSLDNLVAIVDYNKLQALGRVEEVMRLEPFADKWRAFGWAVEEVDGHDLGVLVDAFARVPFISGKPSLVLAHTVKGKGVSFMEDQMVWHYIDPKREHFEAAMQELGGEDVSR